MLELKKMVVECTDAPFLYTCDLTGEIDVRSMYGNNTLEQFLGSFQNRIQNRVARMVLHVPECDNLPGAGNYHLEYWHYHTKGVGIAFVDEQRNSLLVHMNREQFIQFRERFNADKSGHNFESFRRYCKNPDSDYKI